MNEVERLNTKRFLNRDGHFEYAMSGIDLRTFPEARIIRGTWCIKDCNHSIKLDFRCKTTEEWDNAKHKLWIIEDHLNQIRRFLDENKDMLQSREDREARLEKERADA